MKKKIKLEPAVLRATNKPSTLLPVITIIAFFILSASILMAGNKILSVSRYIMQTDFPEAFHGARIVQISDLHQEAFGSDNYRLIQKISKLQPDIILVTGDIVTSGDTDVTIAKNTMVQIAQIAPTFFCMGNHEQYLSWLNPTLYTSLTNAMTKAGVHILDNTSYTWNRGSDVVSISGYTPDMMTYAGREALSAEGISLSEPELLLSKLGKSKENQLLLAHNPDFFESYAAWGADVVFSGHIHGGIVRMPFLGGLINPTSEWFPKYDAGLYESGTSKMVLNRGLGNSVFPWRILNLPDISLITIE